MTYYLRVEGVNLGNFVSDTNDLATIRGGSLLLLESMARVEEVINKQIPISSGGALNQILSEIEQIKRERKSPGGKKKNQLTKDLEELRQRKKLAKNTDQESSGNYCPATITKGASWGLFELKTDFKTANIIRANVVNDFNGHPAYKHSTFVVDLYQLKDGESYQTSRAKAQTLNRWQQLAAPSLAICLQGEDVCAIDKVRPANTKIDLPADPGKRKVDYVSDSVRLRKEHGQDQKRRAKFYKNITKLSDIDGLKLTKDLDELSSNENKGNLHGKIAFIYIDGNEFGLKQKNSNTVPEQQQFDQQTRMGREAVLRNILEQIKGDQEWLIDKKLRLETLLWGGDEIIWVVPAWQGWWMLNSFYKQAEKHIVLRGHNEQGQETEESLYHGSSIVFCKHKAPIHRIERLARSLADGFSKAGPFKQENMIACQMLESFDHAGSDLKAHMEERLRGLSSDYNQADLLFRAEEMDAIEQSIGELKKVDFPKRKIYQIVNHYRKGNSEEAKMLYNKLIGTDQNDPNPTEEQKTYRTELGNLKKIFSRGEDTGNNTHWLHLMELWDYVAPVGGSNKAWEGE